MIGSSTSLKPTYLTVIASFYLIIMLTQFIPLEGLDSSIFKVAAMSLTPLLLIFVGDQDNLSKVLPYVCVYYVLLITCSMHASEVVWIRILYRGLYLSMFVLFYCLLRKGAFTNQYFIRLIGIIITAYTIVSIVQQIVSFFGIHNLPIINLSGGYAQKLSVLPKANGLSIEPSHTGRILTLCYFAFVRTLEIQSGERYSFKRLWTEHVFVTTAYTYSMLFIGSTTALIGFILILCYLFRHKWQYLILLILFFIVLLNIDFEPARRISVVFNAFFSDDTISVLQRSESSGLVRILPIINTIKELDLFSTEAWIGLGTTTVRDVHFMLHSNKTMIGDITNYGIITYGLSLLFIYRCCISKFFSFETLLFLVLLGFGIGSLYYLWGGLLLFSTIKYFEQVDRKEIIG